jgi:hypothetical protein
MMKLFSVMLKSIILMVFLSKAKNTDVRGLLRKTLLLLEGAFGLPSVIAYPHCCTVP